MSILYPVNDIFHSIQGEGFWTGIPATFVRLQGCNLRCAWCDTKETWSGAAKTLTSGEVLSLIKFEHVIITGGEPLLYDLTEMFVLLIRSGKKVHIESNGTQPWKDNYPSDAWITVSPKMQSGFEVHPSLHERVAEYKFIVDEDFDPKIMLEYPFTRCKNLFLSPENVRPEMIDKTVQIVQQYPHTRLMVQLHKLIGIK